MARIPDAAIRDEPAARDYGRTARLSHVLEGLYRSDIASQAHIGSRIDLWIGEVEAGPTAHASFGIGEARGAARWLHRSALRLFPASRYARMHSRRFAPVAILARLWRPF